MGDFNLDGGLNLSPEYYNKNLLNVLNLFATEFELTQIVEFPTWSRIINGIRKESLLDHVYLNNMATFNSVYYDSPVFGDHVLVITELSLLTVTTKVNNALMRKWSLYSKTCH